MFKRTDDQIHWFQKIAKREPLKRDFDHWYLCCLLGLITGEKEGDGGGVDMVSGFIEEYKKVQTLLVSMLVVAELEMLGVDFSEKDEVKKVVDRLIEPRNPAMLSKEGFRLMNSYSVGGFEIIRNEFPGQDRPHSVGDFLIGYGEILKSYLAKPKYS